MSNNNNKSCPVLVILHNEETCPKNEEKASEMVFEIIGQFSLEKTAYDIVEAYVKLQKAGVVKFLDPDNKKIPAILYSNLLEAALRKADCEDARKLAKNERKTVKKMPKGIRTIIERMF